MNLRRLLLLPAASAALLSTSCTMVRVETEADPRIDFAKYRTYAVSQKPSAGSRPLPPASIATLQSNLDSGLSAKGIQKSAKPSFTIAYWVGPRSKPEVFMVPNWGYYAGYGSGYYGCASSFGPWQPMVTRFTDDTLVLAFVDAATKRVIWRAAVAGLVRSQEENEKIIAKAVRKMLEDFPPKH